MTPVVKSVLKYYTKTPVWALNLVAPLYYCLPDSVKYSPTFVREKKELQRINGLSDEQIGYEKNESLKKLVRYAYRHTKYYRELFDNNGVDSDSFQGEKDLYKIPFLTKEILLERLDDLVSDEFSKEELVYITTSGSTGAPTGFYVQKDSPMREYAYMSHMFGKQGYSMNSSKLILRGKAFWAQRKGKNWQWDAFRRELSVNIFDLTPDNLELYCKKIEKYRPEIIHGYPSALSILCSYIQKRPGGLKHQFKSAIAISEMVYPNQRELVKRVLGVRLFSFYGMSERVVIAGECENSSEYHIEPLYGIAELVDNNGVVITEPNISGEIVGTSLLNYGMPLIRYKMGDISYWASGACACGSSKLRFGAIQGRQRDFLVGCKKNLIPLAATSHTEEFAKIRRYRLRQEEIGKATIVAEVDETFSKEDETELLDRYTEKTNGTIIYRLEKVSELKPKPNGKFALLDQRLDLEQYK